MRKLRSGESVPPVSVAQGIATAAPGQVAGTAVGASVEMLVTIVAINADKNTIDLEGPDGAVETVNVANPANLAQVRVGENIVVTLTKVVAISLDKETTPQSTR